MSARPDCTELNAYVDGELDLARMLDIEALLRDDAELRGRVEGLRALRDTLRARADYHAAPDALRARLQATLAAQSALTPASAVAHEVIVAPDGPTRAAPDRLRALIARWFAWRPLAASFALLAMLTVATNLALLRDRADDRLGDEVIASHVRATLAQRLVDVESSDHHTVKPWLSARLDYSPPVRDRLLPDTVFVGGRVDYLDGRPVAALVYRQGRHTVDAYVWPADGNRAPVFYAERGYQIARWTRAGMTFWVVADLNRETFATLVDTMAADSANR